MADFKAKIGGEIGAPPILAFSPHLKFAYTIRHGKVSAETLQWWIVFSDAFAFVCRSNGAGW